MKLRHFARYALLLLSLAGCGESNDERRPINVTAKVSKNISTVVNVRWETEEPSIGYVEYGLTEAMELKTPLSQKESKEHKQALLGLTADTPYYYRVVTWDGEDAAEGDVGEIRTGDLPVGLPALQKKGDGHDQYTIAPVLGQHTAVLIVNPEGEIVWYHLEDRDLDFYRARLSVDGKSLIYNAAEISGEPSEESELVRMALDGSGSTSIKVPLLAHDFVEHPDGTLGAIVGEYRDVEGAPLMGNQIVEIDTDGEQTTVWSTWDCFDPIEHPGDTTTYGWTFANALDYDPNDEAYYVSFRNFSSIAKIDRKSGECEWVLGTTASTLEFSSGSKRFLHEHQFHVFDDHLLVMDNDGAPARESRVIEYELDLEAKTAKEVWSYTSDPSVYTFVLGEPVRLPGGDTFINWSAAGQLERVTSDKESIWQVNTGAGFVFGFHTMATSLYPADAETP